MTPFRIALVVQGRFHAFDLARELSRRGHVVTVFTNYPRWAVRRFDVGAARIRTCWWHGAIVRGLGRLPSRARPRASEGWLHQAFGRWAARALEGVDWDLVHCWSGVSEELLSSARVTARARWLMRGSAHVDVQDALLREEEERVGVRLERPSEWMRARERREYRLADTVVVLSSFARQTFVARQHPEARLVTLPLGVDVSAFVPSPDAIATRATRIRSGGPLRVLYVGSLSCRKGMWDLRRAIDEVRDIPVEWHLVGEALPEVANVLRGQPANVFLHGKVRQSDLPRIYAQADLFVFPTIEDGFGLVLAQAKAAGLPIVCTTNCAGPDFLSEGIDGWVLPIRAASAIAARVRWCHAHRDELADMATNVAAARPPRDWAAVAEAFESRLAHARHGTSSEARPA